MKYKITIEEMVSQDFAVEAENIEAALEIAEGNYNNGKWVLNPGNFICKQICAESYDGKDTVDWYEF